MADLSDTNSSGSTKVVGSDSLGAEQTPVQSTTGGGLHINLRSESGLEISTLSTFPTNNALGLVVRNIPYEPPSYAAAAVGFIPAAAATDIFTITGSATKTIRIRKIRLTGTTTSGSPIRVTFSLVRRSTADTGGTSAIVVSSANDSANAASTATVRNYTANPVLGTLVAAMRAETTAVLNTGMNGGYLLYDFADNPIILRGINEQLCINLGGATVTGPIFSAAVEWSEV